VSAPTLASVELRCPKFEQSRAFFLDVLGLVESEASADTSLLRCVGESAQASVVLRRAERAGLARLVLLDTPRNGAGPWPEISIDGHPLRVVSERAPAPLHSGEHIVRNQPTPLRGVGVEPRRLSHVGLVAPDTRASAAWWHERLHYDLRETVEDGRGLLLSTLAATPAACEVMLVRGGAPQAGGLHHVAFAVDQRDRIADAALLFAELAVPVEVGLGQHGVGQLSYLYCFEPSGNRIALVNSPLQWQRDSGPVHWPPETWRRALWLWGAPPPASFFEVHT
jgi:catechol 2,3-dioxygenase